MKKAFTMMELIFVLVVIGIIAAVVLPNTRSNPVAEAAVELTSKIRYTQHLAMIDDKYGTNNTWFRDRWQIILSGTDNNFYSIMSSNTYAKDALTGEDINGTKLNGVTINLANCSNQNIISFDHLGRPLVGSLAATTEAYVAANVLDQNCTLSLSDGSQTSTITIMPETGYVKLQN